MEDKLVKEMKSLGACSIEELCDAIDTSDRMINTISVDLLEYIANKINWHRIMHKIDLDDVNRIKKIRNARFWRQLILKRMLSEEFLTHFMSEIISYTEFNHIFLHQIVSEEFIRVNKNRINRSGWYEISKNLPLSEDFMSEFIDELNHVIISCTQKLSENFILKHADKLHWYEISTYQILSDEFIIKNLSKLNRMNLIETRKVQGLNLSKNERKIQRRKFKTKSLLRSYIEMWIYAKKHGLKFKNGNLIAFRKHDTFGRGTFTHTHIYNEVGKIYEDWHCDMDRNVENSFGLGIWPKGNVKVKVKVKDWGCAVRYGHKGKGRVKAFTLLSRV